jgi:large subunit ribosomal protein L12e
MGPPPPPGEEKIVLLKAVGGEIGSAAALAPKLGPLGLVSFIEMGFCHL